MATIADIIRSGITAGKSTDGILAEVLAAHPAANTKAASVNWYRSQLKKTAPAPAPKKSAAAVAVASTVAPPAPPAPAAAEYTVRALKATRGIEGEGFIIKLCRQLVAVAEAADYGDGGMVHWTWFDTKAKATVHTRNYLGKVHQYEGTVEEARFAAYCMALPDVPSRFGGEPLQASPDLVIEEMVNDFELARQLKRLVKNKIAYFEGDKLYTLGREPSEQNIAQLLVKPNLVVLNIMPEAEAVALLKKYQRPG
jgi:hypothetical protein